MSQIKMQERIIAEIQVNRLANLKRGETFNKRDERSRAHYVTKMASFGYSESEANEIFNDAKDIALLNMGAS